MASNGTFRSSAQSKFLPTSPSSAPSSPELTPSTITQTIRDHPYHKNDDETLCAKVRFSSSVIINVPIPKIMELKEEQIIKDGPSCVNAQIEKSAFGLFLLALENEVEKEPRFCAKLRETFAVVGKESWINTKEEYRNIFDSLVNEFASQ